jgi:hypothetical protein
LAVDITDNCDWSRNVGHVLVALQDLFGLRKDADTCTLSKTQQEKTNMKKQKRRRRKSWGKATAGQYLFAEADNLVLKQRIAVHDRGDLPVEVLHYLGVHGA